MEIQALIPLLVYQDIALVQNFLVQAFGFERGQLERDDSGHGFHGEVHWRGSTIWLHRATPQYGLASPHALPMQHGGVVVFVDDVDDHYAQARNAGAIIDSAPADQPYGQREYAARDPEGGHWYFATRTS